MKKLTIKDMDDLPPQCLMYSVGHWYLLTEHTTDSKYTCYNLTANKVGNGSWYGVGNGVNKRADYYDLNELLVRLVKENTS